MQAIPEDAVPDDTVDEDMEDPDKRLSSKTALHFPRSLLLHAVKWIKVSMFVGNIFTISMSFSWLHPPKKCTTKTQNILILSRNNKNNNNESY